MKNRKHRRGLQRSHIIHARLYTITYRSLLKYRMKTNPPVSLSEAIERSIVNEMNRHPQLCYTLAETVAQLHIAQAGIHRLTALGSAVTILSDLRQLESRKDALEKIDLYLTVYLNPQLRGHAEDFWNKIAGRSGH